MNKGANMSPADLGSGLPDGATHRVFCHGLVHELRRSMHGGLESLLRFWVLRQTFLLLTELWLANHWLLTGLHPGRLLTGLEYKNHLIGRRKQWPLFSSNLPTCDDTSLSH